VIGIKVTRPTRKESGPFTAYTRTIRFEFFGGEVLEVVCSGAVEKYIKLRSVKTVPPVNKQPGKWLTPMVYKGTSDGRADSEDTVSCERCGASYPASAPGETGFVSTPYGIVRLCVDCAKKWC
jgi:hypothetical protein